MLPLDSQVLLLLDLGEQVRAALKDVADEAALDLLDRYVAGVEDLELALASQESQGGLSRESLEALVNQHSAIAELTDSARSSAGQTLRTLRSKGQGLRAYAGRLPSRISTIRTRKG